VAIEDRLRRHRLIDPAPRPPTRRTTRSASIQQLLGSAHREHTHVLVVASDPCESGETALMVFRLFAISPPVSRSAARSLNT